MANMDMTAEQYAAIKTAMNYAVHTAEIINKILTEAGLKDHINHSILMSVTPRIGLSYATYGDRNCEETGYAKIIKSSGDEDYAVSDDSSIEYQILFADKNLRSRLQRVLQSEKELPMDGLWVSDSDDSDFLDRGVSVDGNSVVES